MKLKFKARVTCIHHDFTNKRSRIYFNHGKQEVILEKPMTKKYDWERKKGETLEQGDVVELTLLTGSVGK